MKIYSVYQLTNSGNIENIFLIQEGFNRNAFFFGLFWILYHQLWQLLIIYIISLSAIFQLTSLNIIDLNQAILFALTLHITLGYLAHHFLQKKLQNSKYELIQIVAGRDQDEALIRFLDKNNDNF